MSETDNVQILPVLPLKNSVLFPYLLMPLAVGRSSSIAAVEAALGTEGKEIIVAAQRDPAKDDAAIGDLYTVATKAVIKKMARSSDSQMELIVLGVERVVVLKQDHAEAYLSARVGATLCRMRRRRKSRRYTAPWSSWRSAPFIWRNPISRRRSTRCSPPQKTHSAWCTCWLPC